MQKKLNEVENTVSERARDQCWAVIELQVIQLRN